MAQHTQDGGAGDAHLRRRIARHLPDSEVDVFLKLCEDSRRRCSVLYKDDVYDFLQGYSSSLRDNLRRATSEELWGVANRVVNASRSAAGNLQQDLLNAAQCAKELMANDSTRHAYDEWLEPSASVPVPDSDGLSPLYALLFAPFRLLWHVLLKGPQVAAVIWFWTKVALLLGLLVVLWRPLNDLRQWWWPPDQPQPVAQATRVAPGGSPPGVSPSPPGAPGLPVEGPGRIPAPAPSGGSLGPSPPIGPEPVAQPPVPAPVSPPPVQAPGPVPSPEPVRPLPPATSPPPVRPPVPPSASVPGSTVAEPPLVSVSSSTDPVDDVGVASPPVDLPPVRIGGTVPRPRKTWDVRAEYPRLAFLQRVQGLVILEVHVDAAGAVEDAVVLRSVPLLDDAAVTAVLQWRYEPTVVDGRPRAAILTETVRFDRD